MQGYEKYNKKLLVEGTDDQHVIWALCEKFDVEENFDVINTNGITNLIKQFPLRLKQSAIETVGIVVDADTNLSSRWLELSTLLNSLGYTVSTIFPSTGLIIKEAGKINIGIWIMPDNDSNGMIEDFIRFLISDSDELLRVANNCLDHIETDQLNKYDLIRRSKALIHTWLAWQETPGTPMGLAITKRFLSTDVQLCNEFIDWLRNLFNN
jgi:hypothetical protein